MKKHSILYIISILFLILIFQLNIKAASEGEIRSLKRIINNGDADKIIELLLQAQNEGLPVDGLLNKAREGAAKQVEVEKILDVLNSKKKLLIKAQEIVRTGEQKGLRVFEFSKKESVDSLVKSMEDGVEAEEIENFINEVIKNNDDINYLVQCTSSFGELIKAKLSREMVKEIITISLEKRINSSNFNDLTEFLIEARRFDYPLSETFLKLKQGIEEEKDIRSLIFDIKFSR